MAVLVLARSLDVDGMTELSDSPPQIIDDFGTVQHSLHYRGTFYEHLELELFPLDSQVRADACLWRVLSPPLCSFSALL